MKAIVCVFVACTPFWPAVAASLWCFERLDIVNIFGKQLFQLIQKDSFLSKLPVPRSLSVRVFSGSRRTAQIWVSLAIGCGKWKTPEWKHGGVITERFQRSWRTLSAAPLHLHTELHSGFRSVLLGNYLDALASCGTIFVCPEEIVELTFQFRLLNNCGCNKVY